jgi:DNA-binding MarR family transcriptional regulator
MSKSIPKRQHAVKLERTNIHNQVQPRTAAGDAFSTFVVHVFRLNGLFMVAGDALAQPVGQTSARWRIMAVIEEEPMSVAQIARAWGLARQSVQRVADELVNDGLVVYEENPRHRRAQLVVLTPEGRSVLQAIQIAQCAWANELGAKIGETDLNQANTILSRVLEVVAKTEASA